MTGMDVSYADSGQTLTVWFDHPWKMHHAERSSEDLILKKDAKGNLIGVEHRSYFRPGGAPDAPGS